MNSPTKSFGFSLFEILVSICVLALLITGSYLYIPKLLAKSRDTRRKRDLYRLSQALETYYDFVGQFPASLPACGQPLSLGSNTFLARTPCQPLTNQPYFYQAANSHFRLYTNLEDVNDWIISTIKCQKGCGPECQFNYGVSSQNINLENCLPPPIIYACSPGGGASGRCEQYDDPERSQCPKIYPDDPACNNECSDPANRCKNSSGKHVPD